MVRDTKAAAQALADLLADFAVVIATGAGALPVAAIAALLRASRPPCLSSPAALVGFDAVQPSAGSEAAATAWPWRLSRSDGVCTVMPLPPPGPPPG